MHVLLRPANLFLILTYAVLSAVPFAPLMWGKTVPLWWQILGMEAVAWLAVWAALKRPAYFHWILLPAFLALPTEIYLQMYYGQGITTHHLGIIAETSPNETLEFLGQKVYLLAAIVVAVVLWFVLSWLAAWRTRALDWADHSRWVVLVLLGIGAALWTYGWQFGVSKAIAKSASSSSVSGASSVSSVAGSQALASGFGEEEEEEEEEEEDEEAEASSVSGSASASATSTSAASWPKLPHWAHPPLEFDNFTRSWPFGLIARAGDFIEERQNLHELSEKNRNFRFAAHQAQPNDEEQVVVLVIGESARYDRWSLNGYERETNPLLKNMPNLVSMADMITSVSATRLSVPVILSRKTATQSLKAGFSEKSFLTAYNEAGFKTWWLSNQISFGQYDTPISVFAKEAQVVQFMNLGGFTNESNYDHILFDPFKTALADPARKKLIVLHTLGSHWNYSHRHPAEFDKWKPSLFGVNKPAYTNLKLKPQINNSYDNTILYTDWFLANLLNRLREQERQASLIYVADHGQTLYDGSCNLAFHGHNTQFEFHVPALVWYSDRYAAAHPDKIKRLKRNHKARLSTENIFHTLLDMGEIRYPGERLERSFLSKKFKPHTRYVDSYGWTNYDNAIIKGACREVIDKDKPLRQEK